MNAIEIKKLTKKYRDVTAVDGLELSVRRGELFALLGVNGAGKTTTIKMLSCLTSPTSGEAFLDGKSIVSQPGEVKRIIGVSPQETAVAPNLTVMENLELMCGVHGLSKDKTRVRAQALCEEFKLGEAKERKAGKLILSDCKSGYFLPTSTLDIQRFISSMSRRSREIAAISHAAEDALLKMTGQETLRGWQNG